ncbi:MAG: GxxExxY protein [Salinisphaera sp.]|nr:GxxExxY protein [Salinisphaera sp.]
MDERDPQTYAIIGAAMEVHRQLGNGFLETVYQEALAWEFEERAVPFAREQPLAIRYKDRELLTQFRADFICFNEIIVETKALQQLSGTEQSQLLNYLKASGLSRGLLINFGQRSLQYKRLAW